METAELQDKIFAYMEATKGKKKLKEKDIIKGVCGRYVRVKTWSRRL